jgi:hypothetical protein
MTKPLDARVDLVFMPPASARQIFCARDLNSRRACARATIASLFDRASPLRVGIARDR